MTSSVQESIADCLVLGQITIALITLGSELALKFSPCPKEKSNDQLGHNLSKTLLIYFVFLVPDGIIVCGLWLN